MKLNDPEMIFKTYLHGGTIERVIVGLHGWTGNEHSMKPVAVGSRILNSKWYFPRGPYSLDGKDQYSWFTGTEEMGWDCERSFSLISKLIDHIQKEENIDPDLIHFVGFSQGACIAMEAGLRQSKKIGGIVAIAGFIRHTSLIKNEITEEARQTPVLILHGEADKIVSVDTGHTALNLLKEIGVNAEIKIYDAGHKIPISAYPMIRDFIIGKNNASST